MAIATLSIDLVAKLANLEAGLNRATQLAEKNAAQMAAAFNRTDAVIGKLTSSLKGLFAGITVGALVKGIVNSLDALVDLRDATGSTIENLSALEDVAVTTGTSFDNMSTILIRFNKVLGEAKAGDDISRTFKAIGLSVEELRKLDPAEALRQTAVAFGRFADDGSKARAMQELFSKSIAVAGPLMNELAAKTELTATVTTKAAKDAENLANNFHKIQKGALDAAREMAGPLNSALEATLDIIGKINAWRDRRFAEQDIQHEKNRVAALEGVNKALADLSLREEDRLHFLQERNRLESESPVRKREAELRELAGPRGGPGLEERPSIVVAAADDGSAKKAAADIAALTQRYRELFEAEMALDGTQQELAKAQSLLADPKYAKATAAQKQAVLDYAAGIHSLKIARDADNAAIAEALQHDKLLGEAMAELTKAAQDADKAFQDMLKSLPTAQFNDLIQKEDDLRQRLEKGQLSAEQFNEALNKLYNVNPDPTIKAIDSIGLAVQDLSGEIDQALGAGLQGLLEGNFKSIGDAFKRMLETMAVKAASTHLMDALFGAQGSGGARQGGGWVDSIVNMFKGFGGGGSSGAAISADTGAGLALGAMESFGTPSYQTNVTYEIASGVSRNELAAMMPAMTQQVQAAVMQTMRRPGFSGA